MIAAGHDLAIRRSDGKVAHGCTIKAYQCLYKEPSHSLHLFDIEHARSRFPSFGNYILYMIYDLSLGFLIDFDEMLCSFFGGMVAAFIFLSILPFNSWEKQAGNDHELHVSM